MKLKLKLIHTDKGNEEKVLKNFEIKISENEKIKQFYEKLINKIMNEETNNKNNKRKRDILHVEKITEDNEMKKIKQAQNLKENDKLQKNGRNS